MYFFERVIISYYHGIKKPYEPKKKRKESGQEMREKHMLETDTTNDMTISPLMIY